MYSLLSRTPTILDYIETWWAGVCECGQSIDVSWLPGDTDVDGLPENRIWITTHCAECVSRKVPAALRPALGAHYEYLRGQRISLGLGCPVPLSEELGVIHPSDVVRRALNWRSDAITLYSGSWKRPGKAEADRLLMDQFMITGTISESRRDDLDPDDIAPRPWFELGPLEPPDRPGESITYARVFLGATIYDTRLPDLKWEYHWNSFVPASIGEFVLPPDWQVHNYSPTQIGKFIAGAMGLFQARAEPGRPRRQPDRERFIDLSETFIEERERAPTSWEEFAAFVGQPPSTLRDYFKDAGLWPWREFKADYFSEQTIERVLRKKSQGFS